MKQKNNPDTELDIEISEPESTEEKPKKGLKGFFSKILSSLVEEVEDDEDFEEESEDDEDFEEEDFEEEDFEEEDFEEEDFEEEESEDDEDFEEESEDDEDFEEEESEDDEDFEEEDFEDDEDFEEESEDEEQPEEQPSSEIFLDAPEDMPDFNQTADDDAISFLNQDEPEEPQDENLSISQDELSDSLQEFLSDENQNLEDTELSENKEDSDENDEDSEEDDEDDDEPERKSFFAIAIPIMITIVVGLGFAYCLQRGVFSEKTVYYMPDLVGTNYYDLGETYQNFNIQVSHSDYSAYDKDVIYGQEIPAGTEIKLGQTINIDLSLGYAQSTIPDVRNYQFEYAQKLLQQSGFATEIFYEKSLNGTTQDNVIRTVPAGGEEVNVGTKVTMYVSEGLGAENAQVQNFTGMLFEDAKAMCEMYGLEVDAVAVPALEAENVVVSQSIEAGTTVPFHTVITLTYSNGEQPKGTVNYQVNFPPYASGRFILDFIDKDGNVIASSDMIIAGFSAGSTIPVEGYGSQEIKVVLNNYATNLQAELGSYHFDFTTGTYTILSEDSQTAFETVDGIA